MPYIKYEDRIAMEHRHPKTAGELNYCITDLCRLYLNHQRLSYQTINDIVGALEGAKLEFYRCIAVPYEEQKIKENGDVY